MASDNKGQSVPSDRATNDSLLSLGSESVTTTSSSALLKPRVQRPRKDYEAALGILQSRYGTGGDIPSPKKAPSRKLPELARQAEGSIGTPSSTPPLTEDNSFSVTTASSSRSSDGSSGDGKGKKKRFSFLRVFQGKSASYSDSVMSLKSLSQRGRKRK